MRQQTFIIANRSNRVLAAEVGHGVAELIRVARPAWLVTNTSHMRSRDRRKLVRELGREVEIPGVKHKARIIPLRPSKPTAEFVESPYGRGEVISREDGFVKFQTADGRVWRLQEAA